MPAQRIGSGHSSMTWENGVATRLSVKYRNVIDIPAGNSAVKQEWYKQTVEGGQMGYGVFAGIPQVGAPAFNNPNLKVIGHQVDAEGYAGGCEDAQQMAITITVNYGVADSGSYTLGSHKDRFGVPLDSWAVQTGYSSAPMLGVDWRGKPITTVLGEPVNVQVNTVVYTLTLSQLATAQQIIPPTINSVALSPVGLALTIPKHCGLRVVTFIKNTDPATQSTYPYIKETHVTFIPKRSSPLPAQYIVNLDGALSAPADIGSFDVVVLHQGYREKDLQNKILEVGYANAVSGARSATPTMSILDKAGKAVAPDSEGNVTPYYLVFQVYEESNWTLS